MKSYKINQSIEKNLYPLETKLDDISKGNRKYLRQFLDIYAPVFVSAILTVVFGESIISNGQTNTGTTNLTFLDLVTNTWWGKTLSIFVLFLFFAFMVFLICVILRKISESKDNKGSSSKRNHIENGFYKVIVPEIINGISLFEKATKIETISNKEKDSINETIGFHKKELLTSKAILYYYESYYHFKLVAEGFQEYQILEFKDSDRENLHQLYKDIGLEALKNAIELCCYYVNKISEKIIGHEEKQLLRTFNDLNRKLLNKKL